ncbi:MAG: FAD/NAD(P)-binding oxidoreductase [Pseudomonadota bacterium]|nr:FAD/NAD(P)-binding oxidoreductase [Pseudomonadota bacterium]
MQRRSFLWSSAAAGLMTLPQFVLADDDAKHKKEGRNNKQPSTSASPAAAVAPPAVAKARVIVIGGGMAGASVAKYLRLWGNTVDVTLVERNPQYLSNIMSSLVLTGQRTISSLTFGYDLLQSRYGVRVVFGDVVEVDPIRARVRLATGAWLEADRIVMAPGIEFDAVPGLDDVNLMPHAWKAGAQTTLLAKQLAAMPTNGVAVLTIPKAPYRCPPGPYERACLIADWMKANKPRAKLIVLDGNLDIVTEKDNFSQAFFGLHASVIDYRTSVEISSVDTRQMMVYTNYGAFKADVVNLIPTQRAGGLVASTGLATANGGRFAPVDVLSYASTVAPNLHVIGDSSATTQPKAGHIANQEAKVCADALARIFEGQAPDPAPVTNSACYSTITRTQASWLTAVFQYDPVARVMVPVAASAAASVGWKSGNFKQMNEWYDALMADTFA